MGKNDTDQFNYVIARKWEKENNQLSCYTFHNTVFYGNIVDARKTLQFIKGRADHKLEEYEIYIVNDKPVE
jgi:hypothetical protein